MASSTKGIVRTNSKDIMHVAHIAEETIREFIRSEVPHYNLLKRNMTEQEINDFKMPEVKAHPAGGYLVLSFRYKGDARLLYVFGDTDTDHQAQFPGRSISLSIGDWGNSVELIRTILLRLAHMGEVYLKETTLNEDPFIKVDAAPMTFVEAFQAGLASGSNLRTWTDVWQQTQPAKTLTEFLGFTQEERAQIIEKPGAVFGILDNYKAQRESRPVTAA